MSESPAGPGNDMQRDQVRRSKTCTAFTMAASDRYISTILHVTCH